MNLGPPASELLQRGVMLERVTLGWNVVGVVVLAFVAVRARSVALARFVWTVWSRSAQAPWCCGKSLARVRIGNAGRYA